MAKKLTPGLVFPAWYILFVAIGLGVFFTLQQYTDHIIQQKQFAFSWDLVLSHNLITYLLWSLLYPWIFREASYLSSNTGKLSVSRIIGRGLLILVIHRLADIIIYHLFYQVLRDRWINLIIETNINAFGTGLFTSLVQYGVFLGITSAYLFYKKSIEKEKDLNKAELKALRSQLNPHFLFNTLHSISSLIDIDKKEAQKMITDFGFLLRKMLEDGETFQVSLQKELEFIKAYLDIELARFQDKLEVKYDIESEALQAKVPYLILQPLVENAVKHGIAPIKENGIIEISGSINTDAQQLSLNIRNTFINRNHSDEHANIGIGIRNVRKRLEQWYPEANTFELKQDGGDFFEATIVIPFEKYVEED